MKIKAEQPGGESDEVKTIPKAAFLAMPESALNPLAERICAAVATEEPEKLNFMEFCRLCGVFAPAGDSETKLKMAFRAFDINEDGQLDAEEMGQVLHTLSHVQLSQEQMTEVTKHIISTFDRDSDGKISYEEFKMLLQKSDAISKMSVAMSIM